MIEHMIGGGKHHPVSFRQYYRLKHIYHLSDIRHDDAVAVLIKDIEIYRRHNRVPHGILLV